MSEFIKTLFEEKEKLDEICHIEEQQRKKIQKHLDTLTDDQIKEMSFEDKVLLKEKYGFFIDTKLVNLLHREIKNGLIKAKGPAIHYPFLKGLVFLTKEQIYDLDEFVNQMRNLNALTQSLANRKLNDTLKETAEYENIEYKEMTLTDEKWKQISEILLHNVNKNLYEEYLENPQEEYEIEVVTDSIDSAALKQEKERLLKRIKEIDHLLNCGE